MEEINNLSKGFLCLILTCHILKCNARLFLDIHLGIALTDTHNPVAAAHTPHHEVQKKNHQSDWQHPFQNQYDNAGRGIYLGLLILCNPGSIQLGLEIRVIHRDRIVLDSDKSAVFTLASGIFLGILLRSNLNLVAADHYRIDFPIL